MQSLHSLVRTLTWVILLAVCFSHHAEAQTEEPETASTDAIEQQQLQALIQQIESYGWQRDGVADLQGRAEIAISQGWRFTGTEGTGKLLKEFGNIPSGEELGMLTTEGLGPWVIFEFDESGYVSDAEKDELDAPKMLESLKQSQKYGNEQRRKYGLAELDLIGWAVEPNYNPATNNLEWGTIVRSSEGGESVNFNTRLLGRKGVMEASLVCAPDEFQTLLPQYQALLTGFEYADGERYAQFKQGDKIAEYGLAALVLGGAAVGAAKLGLFAKLGATLAKFGKVLVIGVIGLGALLMRFFKRAVGAREDTSQPQA